MKLHRTLIPGCYQIDLTPREDARGCLVKTFHATAFREMGLEAGFLEVFYSTSRQNVLRGMHFQLPPADGAKLVHCVQGKVLDVALDLRLGSPAYGKCTAFDLSAENAAAAYIPRGVAHGFYCTEGPSTLVYYISSEYDPRLDAGVLWNSFGFPWPNDAPITSERDSKLTPFAEFKSPFGFTRTEVEV